MMSLVPPKVTDGPFERQAHKKSIDNQIKILEDLLKVLFGADFDRVNYLEKETELNGLKNTVKQKYNK